MTRERCDAGKLEMIQQKARRTCAIRLFTCNSAHRCNLISLVRGPRYPWS
uniref:Uncharacterized protein n=1 Tax=Parascaris equorum TaxID=6256 RepID=A0A914S6N2_PAREQ